MKYVASVSFGKDSTAMILRLLEEKEPLDEVVFYDTGMEFQGIYRVRDMIVPMLKERGIQYTELKPKNPFLFDMLERPKTINTGYRASGYGWCGGPCRWGTTNKVDSIGKYTKGCHVYVGIAVDEPQRLARLEPNKSSPLAKYNMTEADCLRYCREHGIKWDENGIDLYDVLDRVSCWCCRNKNMNELRAIWKCLPEYWERLKDLEDKIGEPMKSYRVSPEYGNLGELKNLEKLFAAEDAQYTLSDFFGE